MSRGKLCCFLWTLMALTFVGSIPDSARAEDPHTRQSYTIDPRYLPEGYVRLGDGVNMLNPQRPVLSTSRAFRDRGLVEGSSKGTAREWAHSIVADSSVFRSSMSIEEEERTLVGYFKASYGLTSAEGAADVASADKQHHDSVYVLIEHHGNTQRADLGSLAWDWRKKPRSEVMRNPAEVLAQFLAQYGSHYVSTITYGVRIGIRGTIVSDKKDTREKFSAEMKTSFFKFDAKGGVSQNLESLTKNEDVQVVLEVTSGGMIPPRPLVITSVHGIYEFLAEMRGPEGEPRVRFKLAPISVSLKSYWSTLPTNWKKTRGVLRPREPWD